MKIKNLILLINIFLLSSTSLFSQCVSSSDIYKFDYDGKTYEIVKDGKDWEKASECAVQRGGQLARIDDFQEQDAVYNAAINDADIDAIKTLAPDGGQASYLWIGGNDIATEGDWIWDGDNDGTGDLFWQGDKTGGPVNSLYNNWGNEPDNYNNQDGLGMAITDWPLGISGQWNDVKSSNNLYFVIEYDSLLSNINETENIKEVSIFPNPFNEELNVVAQNDEIQFLEIISLEGKRLIKIQNPTNKISTEFLPAGTYIINVVTSLNSQTFRIVK